MARAAVTSLPAAASPSAIAAARHPRYLQWLETWRWLGWVYEGDGPFLDGSALVPHPREVIYRRDEAGAIVTNPTDGSLSILGYLPKFLRRQQLATYDNIASDILNTVIDHQFQKPPDREPAEGQVSPTAKAYLDWAETDVDGLGTCLDDWMKQSGRLAGVYGHLFVTLERANARTAAPMSAADLGPLVLRRYTPMDAPDWILTAGGGIQEIKLLEAIPRAGLDVPVRGAPVGADTTASNQDAGDDAAAYEIRRWTPTALKRYTASGEFLGETPHALGVPPVLVLYAKRRVRIPLIGRSLLGDPRVYKDYFNVVSEKRELMRSQTFSMLALGLGPEENAEQGRNRLGTHAGTDSLVFHKGGAEFIAPPDGPLAQYMAVEDALVRKMYKAVGLAWDGDTQQAEAAASRRIKAMDLNRVLAGLGDEAETFEYALARLWFMSELGAERGVAEYNASKLRSAYPDEYFVDSALDRLEEIRQTVGLGFGATFDAMIRKSAVPVIIPGVTEAQLTAISGEIDAAVEQKAEDDALMKAALTQGATGTDDAGNPTGKTTPEPPNA